jgi:hypothetical protein
MENVTDPVPEVTHSINILNMGSKRRRRQAGQRIDVKTARIQVALVV